MIKQLILPLILLISFSVSGQNGYWQQAVDYNMEIDMNVSTNQFQGKQTLKYTNNSPDTLDRVFYHLYFNAFQPNSMMDVRSRTIEDPDRRVGDRIYHLNEDEIGWQKINSFTQDGKKIKYKVVGTILEVELDHPILPHKSSTFKMDFVAQIPLQIRRSGRDNNEGIRYSMTQWYPKMAEYDKNGWHADPYIGREFHSVWGNFDVRILIDSAYILGATGFLQNAEEIGKGYGSGKTTQKPHNGKLSWNFKAEKVLDFAWVADPDYTHTKATTKNGTVLHFLYQKDSTTTSWDSLPKYAVRIFEIMSENFGQYPHGKYTVAQGGDGGMEYPMITLITGRRSQSSLIGVTTHEVNHSWYQHLMATNENLYPWMDEGFTTYTSDFVLARLWPNFTPYKRFSNSYFKLVKSGKQEPLSTHADQYETNFAYGTAAYSMGAMFLDQLAYIVGEEVLLKSLKTYYNVWKFKHPDPMDYLRIVEKESHMDLKWFLRDWIQTTKTIDYGIREVETSVKGKTEVRLERIGTFPMPIDIQVVYTDGSEEWFNIPLRMMRGEKAAENGMKNFSVLEDWPWTFPGYSFTIDKPKSSIEKIEIDPSLRMPDIDRSNNLYPYSKGETTFKPN